MKNYNHGFWFLFCVTMLLMGVTVQGQLTWTNGLAVTVIKGAGPVGYGAVDLDPAEDPDADGVTTGDELRAGTDPLTPEFKQDGLAASRISAMSRNEGTASSSSAPMLYAIDFSSPPHVLLQPPVVDLGPIPRRGPSDVWPYGGANAIVEPTLGPLDRQPVVFRQGGQIAFNVQNLTTPRPDVFTIACDMHIERITGEGLTILIDTPEVRRLDFIPGNIATVWIPSGTSYSAPHPATPIIHIAMEIDLTNKLWSISFNGTLWGRFSLLAEDLTSVRISANGLNGADIAMAFDNILIVGGRVPTDPLTVLSWTNGPAMYPRYKHTATLLKDGRILLVGGFVFVGGPASIVEIYDPVSNICQSTGSLNQARHGHSATLLPDGRVLVIGGYANYRYLGSAEIYDPSTGAWSTTQPLFFHGAGNCTVLLKDGRVLVVGGDKQSGYDGDDDRVELFDPVMNSWSTGAYHEGIGAYSTATLLRDGRILFTRSSSADTDIYDPTNDTWQSAGTISNYYHNYGAASVLLQDGRVMVIGGREGGHQMNLLSQVDIYDPATRAWSPAALSTRDALFIRRRFCRMGGWQ